MINNGTEAVIAKIKAKAFADGHAQALQEIADRGDVILDHKLLKRLRAYTIQLGWPEEGVEFWLSQMSQDATIVADLLAGNPPVKSESREGQTQ